MQDVGQQQFLVLLLVVQAQPQRVGGGGPGRGAGAGDEALHRVVDLSSVLPDLGQRGPAEQPTLRPRVSRSQRLVIRIEQPGPARIDRLVAGGMGLQHQGLEKPGGVGQVPLAGAGLGHRLQRLVFGAQAFGELLRMLANRLVGLQPGLA